jgi:dTDP-4-dehydrorhamnose reductase
MNLLVTGGTGLLGSAVLAAASSMDVSATFHHARGTRSGVTWLPLDLRAPDAAARVVDAAKPDVVIHTAIAIAPGDLLPVIVEGSARIAQAARAAGAALIHVSSDMVFDGRSGPFGEDAPLSPITPYGRAKARAEVHVRAADPGAVIVRCSLLYRLDPPDRSLAAWLEGPGGTPSYPLFVDEIRCPAAVDDVARALVELALRLALREGAPPVLHAVGPAPISRYDFGRLACETLGRDPSIVQGARSDDTRPRELVLTTERTPSWFTAGIRPPLEVRRASP